MKYFVTFGDTKYYNALNRIATEARALNLFDGVFAVTDQSLKSDQLFWDKHGAFVENSDVGYGYWIWKPYIMLNILESLEDNDILVYADAGCKVVSTGSQRMTEYFDLVNKSEYGILSFTLMHPELSYTKKSLLQHFNLECTDPIVTSGQYVGGVVICRKCPHVMGIIKEWYNIACRYDLLDNSTSDTEYEQFIAHRNDQSIFSLLRKIHGSVVLTDETYTYPRWNPEFPIWATRLKH